MHRGWCQNLQAGEEIIHFIWLYKAQVRKLVRLFSALRKGVTCSFFACSVFGKKMLKKQVNQFFFLALSLRFKQH